MLSFSSALLFLAATTTPHADSVPLALAARVQAEIATKWHVDSADVQLAWGMWIGDAADDTAPFRLTGGVNDGWFAVLVTPIGAPPRSVRVHAGTRRDVPVASHSLTIGQHLEATDITTTNTVAWGAPAAPADRSLIGWEVRRPVHEGDQLVGVVVAPPIVITTGDPVIMTWSQGGVHLERQAVALQPARLGESVRVRAGSQQLAGLAIANDTARVTPRP